MANINLRPDEIVVLKRNNVLHSNSKGNYNDELILTNINLYLLRIGSFGKVKQTLTFPLNQIKIHQGNVQAKIGTVNGSYTPELQIYFMNGTCESFSFSNSGKKEMLNWANAISETLTGRGIDPTVVKQMMPYNGVEEIAETIKGSFGAIKDSLVGKRKNGNIDTSVTIKCIGCKAPMSGMTGQMLVCKYCDTKQAV